MNATHLLPRPKSLSDAESEFERLVAGDPRRLNKYLSMALLFALAIAFGLLALNIRTAAQQRERIVVSIDNIGRPQVIGTTGTYTLRDPEVKYFLAQFVQSYYGRVRATLQKDFERSLYFLDGPLAQAAANAERTTKARAKFMYSGDDEVQINVTNIVVGGLASAPYTAEIDLEKVYVNRAGTETKREKFTDKVAFTTAKEINAAAVLINPLSFVVLSISENQAFPQGEK